MKTCTKCGDSKDESRFCKRSDLGGILRGVCKDCRLAVRRSESKNHPNRERDRQYYLEKKKKNPHFQLKGKYGLTTEQWDEMVLNQGGMCAICDQEEKLSVDHNHSNGRIRALLCAKCNCAIGLFRDSSDLLVKATRYLERFS